VPLINTELLVLAVAASIPRHLAFPLVLLATAGTMVGKFAMYLAGRGVMNIRIRRRERVDRFLADLEQRRGLTGSLLFASASLGVPPFYVVAVGSGMARLALGRFLAVGFAGRFLRFAAVVFAPQLIARLLRGAP
jgi:membrane protein YqaA with SNARE-associated domain